MSHPVFSRKRIDSLLAPHSLVSRNSRVYPQSLGVAAPAKQAVYTTRPMHFAARRNGTRLSIIERLGNTRPNWPMKVGNSQADWLGIGVTRNTGKSHIAHGSNYGGTVSVLSRIIQLR